MTKSLVGSRCEKHDVRLLTWARWDKQAKRWKMAGSHDIAYCRNCKDVISMKTGRRFRKQGDFPPDPARGNDLAAERVHAAIAAYRNFMREDRSYHDLEFGDFLADLLHYRDRYRCDMDFNDALEWGERHYGDESSDNLADALGVVEVIRVSADGSEKLISTARGSSKENTETR